MNALTVLGPLWAFPPEEAIVSCSWRPLRELTMEKMWLLEDRTWIRNLCPIVVAASSSKRPSSIWYMMQQCCSTAHSPTAKCTHFLQRYYYPQADGFHHSPLLKEMTTWFHEHQTNFHCWRRWSSRYHLCCSSVELFAFADVSWCQLAELVWRPLTTTLQRSCNQFGVGGLVSHTNCCNALLTLKVWAAIRRCFFFVFGDDKVWDYAKTVTLILRLHIYFTLFAWICHS